MSHKSHDPCSHNKNMEIAVTTFVAHCTDGSCLFKELLKLFTSIIGDYQKMYIFSPSEQTRFPIIFSHVLKYFDLNRTKLVQL